MTRTMMVAMLAAGLSGGVGYAEAAPGRRVRCCFVATIDDGPARPVCVALAVRARAGRRTAVVRGRRACRALGGVPGRA